MSILMGHCRNGGYGGRVDAVSDPRVRFALGPVASDMARAWIDNSRQLLHAVRLNAGSLHIDVDDHAMEFCAAVLDVWSGVAERGEVFSWAIDTTPEQLLMLARQWLAIGALTDDELASIGCQWAPEWTRPFADALTVGVLAALQRVPGGADELIDRLRDTDTASV